MNIFVVGFYICLAFAAGYCKSTMFFLAIAIAYWGGCLRVCREKLRRKAQEAKSAAETASSGKAEEEMSYTTRL